MTFCCCAEKLWLAEWPAWWRGATFREWATYRHFCIGFRRVLMRCRARLNILLNGNIYKSSRFSINWGTIDSSMILQLANFWSISFFNNLISSSDKFIFVQRALFFTATNLAFNPTHLRSSKWNARFLKYLRCLLEGGLATRKRGESKP